MFETAAEAFQEGLHQLERGSLKNAHPYFRQAFQMDAESRGAGKGSALGRAAIQGDPFIVSYYALGLGLEELELNEALRLAKWAVGEERTNGELHCNLAYIFHQRGVRSNAVKHLELAGRFSPENPRVGRLWKKVGRRNSPPLPFLGRDNPLNKFLGILLRRHMNG